MKLLQHMVRTGNGVTHDYYDREMEIKAIVSLAITNGKDLVNIVDKFEKYFLE